MLLIKALYNSTFFLYFIELIDILAIALIALRGYIKFYPFLWASVKEQMKSKFSFRVTNRLRCRHGRAQDCGVRATRSCIDLFYHGESPQLNWALTLSPWRITSQVEQLKNNCTDGNLGAFLASCSSILHNNKTD